MVGLSTVGIANSILMPKAECCAPEGRGCPYVTSKIDKSVGPHLTTQNGPVPLVKLDITSSTSTTTKHIVLSSNIEILTIWTSRHCAHELHELMQ